MVIKGVKRHCYYEMYSSIDPKNIDSYVYIIVVAMRKNVLQSVGQCSRLLQWLAALLLSGPLFLPARPVMQEK